MISASLTHIAILVCSMDRTVAHLRELDLEIHPFQEFEQEGTRECYIGSADKTARLLLMEAIQEGPYQRALEKRGPGLHHLGVQIPDLEAYAEQLGRAGWLLHTRSLATIKKQKTAYFARPSTPFLVEAWEHETPAGPVSIEQLQIGNANPSLMARIQALGIGNAMVTATNSNSETFLTVEGLRVPLSALTGEC